MDYKMCFHVRSVLVRIVFRANLSGDQYRRLAQCWKLYTISDDESLKIFENEYTQFYTLYIFLENIYDFRRINEKRCIFKIVLYQKKNNLTRY